MKRRLSRARGGLSNRKGISYELTAHQSHFWPILTLVFPLITRLCPLLCIFLLSPFVHNLLCFLACVADTGVESLRFLDLLREWLIASGSDLSRDTHFCLSRDATDSAPEYTIRRSQASDISCAHFFCYFENHSEPFRVISFKTLWAFFRQLQFLVI